MGWVLLIGGGALALIPGMITHTVNGASMLGAIVSVVGALMITMGVNNYAD
jgi:hypothetical protein